MKVAAGENIALPVFGSLLRGLGAFFIRRRLDHTPTAKCAGHKQVAGGEKVKDYLYRGVLQEVGYKYF